MKHSSYTLLKGAIDSLCYSILLRPVAHRVLPFNALRIAKVPHAVAHVFSSLVISSGFDLCTKLVLSKCLELLECTKCITLFPKWRDSPEPAIIINKDDPVLVAMSGLDREWAMKVRVDQLKWSSCSVGCKSGDIGPVLLACNARLTDRIWSSVGLDHHPLH